MRRRYGARGYKAMSSALLRLLAVPLVALLFPVVWLLDVFNGKEHAVKAAMEFHNSTFYSRIQRVTSVERLGLGDYAVTFEVCHKGKCYEALIECFGDHPSDCRVGQ